MKKSTVGIALIAGFALLQIPLAAQARAKRGVYAGGYVSRTQNDSDAKSFDDAALSAQGDFGLSRVQTASIFDKGDKTSFGLLLGYRWLRNFAIELDYLDLGEQKYRANDTVTDGTTNFSLFTALRTRNSGIGLSALLIQPLGDYFEIYARGGLVFDSSRTEVLLADDAGGAVAGSNDHSGVDPTAGIGISATVMDTYSIRLEYRRVFGVGNTNSPGGGGDISLATAGITVRF